MWCRSWSDSLPPVISERSRSRFGIRWPPVRTVADIVAEMAARTRPEDAATWDPVGLQVGDPRARAETVGVCHEVTEAVDRKSTRLNSSHVKISYAVFCL